MILTAAQSLAIVKTIHPRLGMKVLLCNDILILIMKYIEEHKFASDIHRFSFQGKWGLFDHIRFNAGNFFKRCEACGESSTRVYLRTPRFPYYQDFVCNKCWRDRLKNT